MIRSAAPAFYFLTVLFSIIGSTYADNPIIQIEYTADPAPLVYNDRLYLFTSHDEDGSTDYTMRDWLLYSTDDMGNWQHHGSPMGLRTFDWADMNAWAGQVVHRNGKFYFYVPIRNKATRGMSIGVGVSENILGPFVDAIGGPLLENGEIDPTVFIDDDGQAYLYWGNPSLWYVQLNEDMISYNGEITKVELTAEGFGARSGVANRPTAYEEGPWFYKYNDLYYMVYAASCCPEDIRYSTSPTATGPWTYHGTIMAYDGGSFTNHAGLITYKDRPYFFYHNGLLPGGGGFTRSVAVEEFAYGQNGSIPEIRMTTTGPSQLKALDPYHRQEAETIAWSSGIETEICSEGGINIGYTTNGSYIKVKRVGFGSGAASFTARVASAREGGSIELRLDSENGRGIGSCAVLSTGGWQTWTTVTCPVTEAAGDHDLYLHFTGGSGYLFNMDWWSFQPL